MNSWYQLLLLDMNRGKYVGQRPLTEYNWLVLRSLVWEMQWVRVT